jgi:hypothetical protein
MTIKPVTIEENGEREGFAKWVWTTESDQIPTIEALVSEISANAASVVLDQIKSDLSARVDIYGGEVLLSVNVFSEVYAHFSLSKMLADVDEDDFLSDDPGGLLVLSNTLRQLAARIDAKLDAA